MNEINFTRRSMIAILAAAGFTGPAWARQTGEDIDESFMDSEEFLDELFLVNAEYYSTIKTMSINRATRKEILATIKDGTCKGEWASTTSHPDLVHTAAELDETPFKLTHDVLASMARHNFFFTAAQLTVAGKIIFGLRGCEQVNGLKSNSGTSIELREAKPDHQTWKCVIGVWSPAEKTVSTYLASTVPNLLHMQAHARDPSTHGASMLATGLHRHAVGNHPYSSKGDPGAIIPTQQPGALRAAKAPPLIRLQNTKSPMKFALNGSQVKWNVSEDDNLTLHIHAGNGDRPLSYSSAGCQVIEGYYRPTGTGEAYGAWATFRKDLGLSPDFVSNPAGGRRATEADRGRKFDYMLLTGREARQHATHLESSRSRARSNSLLRLRFGSRGLAAAMLESSLRRYLRLEMAAASKSEFDRSHFAQVLQVQESMGMGDGIVTPKLAARLNLDLVAAYGASG